MPYWFVLKHDHMQGCSQGIYFTKALAEFQHVNCMIVQIWEVKRVACYARAETFTEAVASVASMVATPLMWQGLHPAETCTVKLVLMANILKGHSVMSQRCLRNIILF